MSNILFLDFVGAPFDGNTPRQRGLGGSELAQIQLAEALAKHGHKVHVLVARDTNATPREINGVSYGHGIPFGKLHNVICSRMTPLPKPIKESGAQVITSLTDMGPHDFALCDMLVGVSHWQLKRFDGLLPGAKRKVIPPIIEKPPVLEHVPNRYIYASGRMKGLDATLAMWKELRPQLPPGAELRVTTAGWDLPEPGSVEAAGATWLGVLTPSGIRREIAQASGLFYVNTYPETFCAVAALAELAGTTPYILCTGDPGGLPEAINSPWHRSKERFVEHVLTGGTPRKAAVFAPKNYSENKVVQKWEQILK